MEYSKKQVDLWQTLDDLGQSLVEDGIRSIAYGLVIVAIGSGILLLTRK